MPYQPASVLRLIHNSPIMYFRYLETPLGRLLLAADETGLRKIVFPDDRFAALPESSWRPGDTAFTDVVRQLDEYFAGRRTTFDVCVRPEGTAFQQTVWLALMQIPYGNTVSYGALAARIGKPGAARAVGLANGSNPIPIIIPCHRVIGANGKLTGYGGGLPIKERLLALERGERRLVE
jgi:methylated-DNA-[protein]-cysteine S-methyltransferase